MGRIIWTGFPANSQAVKSSASPSPVPSRRNLSWFCATKSLQRLTCRFRLRCWNCWTIFGAIMILATFSSATTLPWSRHCRTAWQCFIKGACANLARPKMSTGQSCTLIQRFSWARFWNQTRILRRHWKQAMLSSSALRNAAARFNADVPNAWVRSVKRLHRHAGNFQTDMSSGAIEKISVASVWCLHLACN